MPSTPDIPFSPGRLTRPLLVLLVAIASGCGHAGNDGVTSRALQFDKLPFRVVDIDLDRARLELFWRNPDTGEAFGDIATLEAWGQRHQRRLLFATNAGIYDSARAPLGLFVENGKQLVALNTTHGNPRHGNFSLLPNGVFAIDVDGHAGIYTTKRWKRAAVDARLATQSGPMLVIDGQLNPQFKRDSSSVKWRSGVCVRKGNDVVFAISQSPVNFHTFARLFRDRLGCRDALYLDGTLSQFHVDGENYGPPSFMVKPWAGMFGVFARDNGEAPHPPASAPSNASR